MEAGVVSGPRELHIRPHDGFPWADLSELLASHTICSPNRSCGNTNAAMTGCYLRGMHSKLRSGLIGSHRNRVWFKGCFSETNYLCLWEITQRKNFPPNFRGWGAVCWLVEDALTKQRFLLCSERLENGAEDESPDRRRSPGSSQIQWNESVEE